MLKSNFIPKLNKLLTSKDKKILLMLLVLSFFLSIIETVGITAIMPFISIASNPDLIQSNKYYTFIFNFFNFSEEKNFVIVFGIALILFYFFRAFYIILHGYLVGKFAMKKYHDFVVSLYSNYIYMPYKIFASKNSATMSKVIMTEAAHVSFLVQSLLQLLSEAIVILLLYCILLLVNVEMTLLLTLILAVKVFLLMRIISKKIKLEGDKRALLQDRFYRIVNESFGNFKIIKFMSNQRILTKTFEDISDKFRNVYVLNSVLQLIPRNVLETLGFSLLILAVIYIVGFQNNIQNVMSIITMYALAMYRILPATTRIINSYNNIVFYSASMDVVYDDITMRYECERDKNIKFKDSIILQNLTFSYKKDNVIDNISLKIDKGTKIAFIGESGSGKSTLVDLICGIYRPNSGQIMIDNIELDNSNIVSWRKRIGYIPQTIYLFDGTIAENITFGRDYDEKKLIDVLKQANIYDFIQQKEGSDTMVGEGGIQLSGGQKQRIGIARALYGNPEVLVLDEATSALDTVTEKAIMNEIYQVSEDKTLIIIAHRLSTIERCDIKIDLSRVSKND